MFADPGDENPVALPAPIDPFARPAPLPMQVEQDATQVMRRLEVWRDEFFA